MVILGDSSQCLVVEATDIAEYSKSEVLSIKHVPVPEGTREALPLPHGNSNMLTTNHVP